jgi:hypothetical protein
MLAQRCSPSLLVARILRETGNPLETWYGKMAWEAVTALATIGTGVAIVATVLLGIRQLELTRSQLELPRRATQLDGALKIFDDRNNPPIEKSSELLTEVVRIHRTANDDAFWENFETLYREGKRHAEGRAKSRLPAI